ncbi:MAG: DNA recombination protein RmuC [Pseudomonadota bacterium]
MNPDFWPLINAASSLLALILLLVALILLARGPRQGALEAALREETTRAREEATAQASALRQEISTGLLSLRQDLVQVMERAAGVQESQLNKFATSLEVFRKIMEGQLDKSRAEETENARQARQELGQGLTRLGEAQTATLAQLAQAQQERLSALAQRLDALTQNQETRLEAQRQALVEGLAAGRAEMSQTLQGLSQAQGQSLAQIKDELKAIAATVQERLDKLTSDNAAKLEQMRQTVDEKLQGTLEKRLGESFGLVSRQLEMVHKSVGEMQGLANGVGDLKRMLSNVKTRGTWGEVQLGNLLDEVFIAEQVAKNVEIRPGSGQRVEFAIRLPGPTGDNDLLLPIDAKFPQEDYERLLDAAERADALAEEVAIKALEARLKAFAKDIGDKYISPPHSTDFAIMYLPTEGLYAEVLRRPGLAETLWREYRVQAAGPTNLAAMLNSLKMGFRTLAIQKRSSEIWQVLSAVKTEFAKYGVVMEKVRKKLHEAEKHIDDVAVRKRVIDRKLKVVQELPEAQAAGLLGLEGNEPLEGEADEDES